MNNPYLQSLILEAFLIPEATWRDNSKEWSFVTISDAAQAAFRLAEKGIQRSSKLRQYAQLCKLMQFYTVDLAHRSRQEIQSIKLDFGELTSSQISSSSTSFNSFSLNCFYSPGQILNLIDLCTSYPDVKYKISPTKLQFVRFLESAAQQNAGLVNLVTFTSRMGQ